MGRVLSLDELAEVAAERTGHGERAVFTNGCFDLLHLGHVTYLQQARDLGDFLIVGLNSDDSTRRLKGPRRPLTPQGDRAEVLAALACVDYVTIFDDNTAEPLVARLRPAVYVKGADYAGETGRGSYRLDATALRRLLADDGGEYPALAGLGARLPEARTVAEYGGELALLPYLPGHSTTELIQRIVSRYASPADAPQAQ
ncbi:MAG TPA: adenylyltransferase/cytidyltransferase family protein [Dehalococcoidia bacterium]|nr:adenylyltransferase/cytidyltransferase family protein [Dehalococcoidia bacterium]